VIILPFRMLITLTTEKMSRRHSHKLRQISSHSSSNITSNHFKKAFELLMDSQMRGSVAKEN